MYGPGDFCVAGEGEKQRVILACPECGGVMSLSHKIETRDPLTLAPSVQGPEDSNEVASQVLGPCGHHFWIRGGSVEGL